MSSRNWHDTFRQWAQPPSETEDQKASNAQRMIQDAVRSWHELQDFDVEVYPTGSYRNNTSARTDSDVDVAVVLKRTFFHDHLPTPLTPELLRFEPGEMPFNEFKDRLGRALREKFKGGVSEGGKAFDVHENSYRLDADVCPFFRHRRYTGRKNVDGSWHYLEGVEMTTRADVQIVNWHHQHYDNGVAKNDATGKRFKRLTRILKRLRTEMADQSVSSPIPSFLIESMVYNVPERFFNQAEDTYYHDVRQVIGWLWQRINKSEHEEFTEVSGLKRLFHETQRWTAQEAENFLYAAWNYVRFGND